MLNVYVKQIAVGIAFIFIAMVAGAAGDTAIAKHKGDPPGWGSGYPGVDYGKQYRHRRCLYDDCYRRRHYGGNRYHRNKYRWPYYGGPSFRFGFGYPYYGDYDYYGEPYYYNNGTGYGSCGRPWTKSWRRCCDAKYRSFNPETGRFLSYSGRWKMCR